MFKLIKIPQKVGTGQQNTEKAVEKIKKIG